MSVREIAARMAAGNTPERETAERMIGRAFDEMTPGERVLAAECIAAFGTEA